MHTFLLSGSNSGTSSHSQYNHFKRSISLRCAFSASCLSLYHYFHEHRTHLILVELELLHCISLYLNALSRPKALWQVVVCSHYIEFHWYPPIFFCFRDSFIIELDPMGIIALVWTLKSGCAAKDVTTHHLTTIRLSTLSISGIWRVPLMNLDTLTRFSHSYSSGILTQVHTKKWLSWCIYWPLTWQISDLPLCGGILLPATCLVASTRPQD